jgi:hypothetical protein
MAKDRFAKRGKTDVHGQCDLTPSAPGASSIVAMVALGMFLNRPINQTIL